MGKRLKGFLLKLLPAVVIVIVAAVLVVLTQGINRNFETLNNTTPEPTLAPPALAFRPTDPLFRVGSIGPEVIALQQRLSDLGYYQGELDGKYYEGTQAAVKVFQAQNNLEADGIAGQKTLLVLNSQEAKPYSDVSPSPPPQPLDGSYATPRP